MNRELEKELEKASGIIKSQSELIVNLQNSLEKKDNEVEEYAEVMQKANETIKEKDSIIKELEDELSAIKQGVISESIMQEVQNGLKYRDELKKNTELECKVIKEKAVSDAESEYNRIIKEADLYARQKEKEASVSIELFNDAKQQLVSLYNAIDQFMNNEEEVITVDNWDELEEDSGNERAQSFLSELKKRVN